MVCQGTVHRPDGHAAAPLVQQPLGHLLAGQAGGRRRLGIFGKGAGHPALGDQPQDEYRDHRQDQRVII